MILHTYMFNHFSKRFYMLYRALLTIALFSGTAFAGVIQLQSESQLTSLTATGVVVIDFYAGWCKPCERMHPIINELASEFPSITFIKVDTERFRDLASRWGVSSLPTFIFVRNGQRIDKRTGAMNKNTFKSILKSVL